MPEIRINFGVSDTLRDWILAQPNITGIHDQSTTHISFYHEMTNPQKTAFRAGFIQMLVEEFE